MHHLWPPRRLLLFRRGERAETRSAFWRFWRRDVSCGGGRANESQRVAAYSHEPMISLVKILSTLADVDGRIKIDGLDEQIAPLTDEERATYASIDFDMASDRRRSCCLRHSIFRRSFARISVSKRSSKTRQPNCS